MVSAAKYPKSEVTGVILAGGRARRMGGEDKGLVTLNARPMISHVVDRMRTQVEQLIINANRNLAQYQAAGQCTVVADRVGEYAGPLAGMVSAMQASTTTYVLTVPCDSPLVSPSLGTILYHHLEASEADLSVAHDGERLQPVFALIKTALAPSIVAFLEAGERKIDRWYQTQRMVEADLSAHPETFLNINTPGERAALESRLSQNHAPNRAQSRDQNCD